MQVDFIMEYAYKYIRLFGYYDLYLENGAHPIEDERKQQLEKDYPDHDQFIAKFNEE